MQCPRVPPYSDHCLTTALQYSSHNCSSRLHHTKAGSGVVFTRRPFDILYQPVKDLDVTVNGNIDLLHSLRVGWQILGEVAHLLNEEVTWTRKVLFHCVLTHQTRLSTPRNTWRVTTKPNRGWRNQYIYLQVNNVTWCNTVCLKHWA